jgi:hypothetical protein
VALVRTDVSEEPGASFIRVTKIGELGTTQAATSNRRTLRRKVFLRSVRRLLEPHGVTTQKTPFFIRIKYSNQNLFYFNLPTLPNSLMFNVNLDGQAIAMIISITFLKKII